MAKTLDRSLELGAVHDDLRVREARQAEVDAAHARDRADEAARAGRATLGTTAGEVDGRVLLRARMEQPQLERAALEADLAYRDAAAAAREAERLAVAQRWPAARERVRRLVADLYVELEDEVLPRMMQLREQIASENAALGRQQIPPGDLLWPEVTGPQGDGSGSLLELRRTQLQAAGWLD